MQGDPSSPAFSRGRRGEESPIERISFKCDSETDFFGRITLTVVQLERDSHEYGNTGTFESSTLVTK